MKKRAEQQPVEERQIFHEARGITAHDLIDSLVDSATEENVFIQLDKAVGFSTQFKSRASTQTRENMRPGDQVEVEMV